MGYTKNIESWPYNSYKLLLTEQKTFLKRRLLYDWFGGKEKYILFHQQSILEFKKMENRLV